MSTTPANTQGLVRGPATPPATAPATARSTPAPATPASRTQAEVRANAARRPMSEQVAAVKAKLYGKPETETPAPTEAPEAPEVEAREAPDTQIDDATDSAEDSIEYLDDLISTLGVDAEAFKSLKAKTKVDGQEVEATLAELLSSYSFTAKNTQTAQKLAADMRRLQAERTEQLQALKAEVDKAKQIAQATYSVIQGQMQSPGIQALREQDSKAFLAWQDLTARQAAAVQQHYNQIVQYEAAQAAQAREQFEQAATRQLRDAIPDWDTKERRDRIKQVFADAGGSESEMAMILDPRIIKLASDFADLQDEVKRYKAAEAEAKKLAKESPKPTARAGAPVPRNTLAKQVEAAKAAQKGLRGRAALAASAETIKLQRRLNAQNANRRSSR